MSEQQDEFDVKYTNLCNPLGPQANDLALLLRRFADHLEAMAMDPGDLLHVVVADQITEYGSWWDITAYYDDRERDPD
jgi:hypothetical protein